MSSGPVGSETYGVSPYGSLPSFDRDNPVTAPVNPAVGKVYEIALNGQGYMLCDGGEDESLRYDRQRIPLDPPRLVTQETPFSDSFERYFHTSYADWTGGSGQTYLERDTSSTTRYLDSEGINPFDVGELKLLHASAVELADNYATPRAVVVDDDLYVQTADNELTTKATIGGASSTIALPAACTDLTADGRYWYACCGASGIRRGTSSANAWSAIQASKVGFAGNRIVAAYASASPVSTTPNVFTTLAEDGTEEVASGRLILNPGWTITDFTGGNGFIFFSAYAGDRGVIYKWQVGSADDPSIAMELLAGQIPQAIYWYQGQVMVRADEAHESKGIIYRCPVADDGTLSPFVVSDDIETKGSEPAFAADERLIFFSWPSMTADGYSGIGALDLSTGGYAKWFSASAAGSVRSVFTWQGRIGFCVDGVGVVLEQTTYRSSGWLTMSVTDRASALDKRYDAVTVGCASLATSESIDLDFSFDNAITFANYPLASLELEGTTRRSYELNKKAANMAVKITLNGPSSTTPVVSLVQIRQHTAAIADSVVQLPIDCGDEVKDLKGHPLAENGPGKGVARARALEALVKSYVKFQDVDWAWTENSEIFEVYSVRIRSLGTYDPHSGKQRLRQIALVTLRKGAE